MLNILKLGVQWIVNLSGKKKWFLIMKNLIFYMVNYYTTRSYMV